jgi:hypothetical protein
VSTYGVPVWNPVLGVTGGPRVASGRLLRLVASLVMIIAPQASFEESATTEASRRCPLTGFLREFGVSFSAHTFEAYTTDIGHLDVQNTVPEMLQIGPNLSVVCLFVCHSVVLDPFLEQVDGPTDQFC